MTPRTTCWACGAPLAEGQTVWCAKPACRAWSMERTRDLLRYYTRAVLAKAKAREAQALAKKVA